MSALVCLWVTHRRACVCVSIPVLCVFVCPWVSAFVCSAHEDPAQGRAGWLDPASPRAVSPPGEGG